MCQLQIPHVHVAPPLQFLLSEALHLACVSLMFFFEVTRLSKAREA